MTAAAGAALTSSCWLLDHRAARAAMRAALETLGAQVDRVRQDAGFLHTLEVMARFWRYSPTNQWLIQRACPRATLVAGRRVWERSGRKVREGATPIGILAPTGRGFPFVVVPVYDVSQTRGRRLPALDLTLRGSTHHVATLERAAAHLGVTISTLRGAPGLVGQSLGGEIRVRPDLSPRERAATLAHELAHELLHTGVRARKRPVSRTHAEVETEAEATSYVVLRALGLPSKAPTYIAWRGGSGEVLARSLGRVQRAARQILQAGTRVRAVRGAPIAAG